MHRARKAILPFTSRERDHTAGSLTTGVEAIFATGEAMNLFAQALTRDFLAFELTSGGMTIPQSFSEFDVPRPCLPRAYSCNFVTSFVSERNKAKGIDLIS